MSLSIAVGLLAGVIESSHHLGSGKNLADASSLKEGELDHAAPGIQGS
jgi:hypothetical protein